MGVAVERASQDKSFPPWVSYEHLARFEFAASLVSEMVVIDCACGTGMGTDIFAKAGAKTVLAFDKSSEAIEEATKAFGRPGISFVCGDVARLPLDDSTADIYISLETIEHLPDDSSYLTEALRVLKPGGVFVCSAPNRLVTNPGKSLEEKPWNPFHVREYSAEEFLELLGRYFERISPFAQNPQPPWQARLSGWLGRRLSRTIGVWFNRVMKLARVAFDKPEMHAVRSIEPGRDYEYLVCVCRKAVGAEGYQAGPNTDTN